MNNSKTSSTHLFLLPGVCYLTELLVLPAFPQSRLLNAILGGLWSLGQVGILVILRYLYLWKITHGKSWKILGVAIAAAGAISYLVNYVFGFWLQLNTKIFLPLGALLSGIGMLITGIQVIAGKRWQGLAGLTPLLVGLYPFAVMFPLLMIKGRPDLTAIMVWGIPWLLLGLARAAENRRILKDSSTDRFYPRNKPVAMHH